MGAIMFDNAEPHELSVCTVDATVGFSLTYTTKQPLCERARSFMGLTASVAHTYSVGRRAYGASDLRGGGVGPLRDGVRRVDVAPRVLDRVAQGRRALCDLHADHRRRGADAVLLVELVQLGADHLRSGHDVLRDLVAFCSLHDERENE